MAEQDNWRNRFARRSQDALRQGRTVAGQAASGAREFWRGSAPSAGGAAPPAPPPPAQPAGTPGRGRNNPSYQGARVDPPPIRSDAPQQPSALRKWGARARTAGKVVRGGALAAATEGWQLDQAARDDRLAEELPRSGGRLAGMWGGARAGTALTSRSPSWQARLAGPLVGGGLGYAAGEEAVDAFMNRPDVQRAQTVADTAQRGVDLLVNPVAQTQAMATAAPTLYGRAGRAVERALGIGGATAAPAAEPQRLTAAEVGGAPRETGGDVLSDLRQYNAGRAASAADVGMPQGTGAQQPGRSPVFVEPDEPRAAADQRARTLTGDRGVTSDSIAAGTIQLGDGPARTLYTTQAERDASREAEAMQRDRLQPVTASPNTAGNVAGITRRAVNDINSNTLNTRNRMVSAMLNPMGADAELMRRAIMKRYRSRKASPCTNAQEPEYVDIVWVRVLANSTICTLR